MREPCLIHGTFEKNVGDLLRELKNKGLSLAPSFFADPCGVEGLTFATLKQYFAEGRGEALLFFNYSGITRISGLDNAQDGTLGKLFGSVSRERNCCFIKSRTDLPPKEKKLSCRRTRTHSERRFRASIVRYLESNTKAEELPRITLFISAFIKLAFGL